MPLPGVIGTAGHIDHGKTALVRALTGIDTDRLKEEKARGITIELGFAHLALSDGREVGVVDVPGHERFIRAMVAGAAGIDLVLLVVAADEGVMPQTREHLDICELLGIGRGVVALSKIDVAPGELRALAEADVRDALRGTALEAAPIVPCSARTGEGLDRLRAEIERALLTPAVPGIWPTPLRAAQGPARLPVDRVFTMKGFGSVVTGSLWSGTLSVGDEVELLPNGGARSGPIRGLQVHGRSVVTVPAGQRVAVNLPLPRDSLERGLMLGHAGGLETGRVFDAQIMSLPTTRRPLARRSRLLLHAGTVQVEATVRLLEADRLAPGERAFVEIETERGLVLLPGDRFVLRGFSTQRGYGTTVGGGVVVRVLGERSRRGAPTAPGLLAENLAAQRAGDVELRLRLELERAGEAGLDRAASCRRLPFGERAIAAAAETLLARRASLRFDRSRQADISAAVLDRLRARAGTAVATHHRAHPLDRGPSREALRASVSNDPRLLHLVLETLLADGQLIAERDRVRLPSHDPARSAREGGLDDLGERVAAILSAAGLSPPRIVDLPPALGPQSMIGPALEGLARAGRAVRVQTLWFDASALASLRARLVDYLVEHGEISAAQWKMLVGASRKYTIPLAEYFDEQKLTLRVGDARKLRGG